MGFNSVARRASSSLPSYSSTGGQPQEQVFAD